MIDGLILRITSIPSPSRSMAPGAKFSTITSALVARSLTRARPFGSFRLTVMDFLLALNSRKYGSSLSALPPSALPGSPPPGFSSFTTSAPSQASASVQDGPASNWVRSSTRTPERQLSGALFSVIGVESSKAAAKSHDSAGDPVAERQQFREQPARM